MEKTLEEKVPVTEKVPDDDQGWIGRQLRDRDMLRKRKAEAEERATNQAQSSKRIKRETNSVQRKKGRPKKNIPVKEQQPETTKVQDEGEIETPSQADSQETLSTLDSASIPAQASAPALDVPQIPAAVSVPIPLPAPDVTAEIKPSSEALFQEVLIEDLGPDEEEDKAVAQDKLVIDQGGVEEPTAIDISEQNKAFSDTVLASPQPDSLPGNLI